MNSNAGFWGRLTSSRFGARYLGDKAFYMTVLSLIVPIVIQNSISNFVNLLDNIMVGAVSTQQMSGVSIANQMVFVFSLCVFGGISGASIFAAQFHGAKNVQGMRDAFRYSLVVAGGISLLAAAVMGVFREQLVSLYINDATDAQIAEETLRAGADYLLIMVLGFAPFAVSQAYAGILRVSGEARLPMYAAIAGVLVNLAGNYVLIFGHLGFPAMNARGAAIATVVSRYVEMLIILIVAHARERKRDMYPFLHGAYKKFRVPAKLVKDITLKGMPLLVNEALWSMGMATLSQQYSMRGLTVVAANTVTSTLTNLFNVFFLSMGTAASVMVGRALGARDAELAKGNARRIIFFEIVICLTVGALMFACAPLLPRVFKETNGEVRALAAKLIRVCACAMVLSGFAHCSYFILRAGGRTLITFLFDSAFTWAIPIPLVYALVNCTQMDIVGIFILCHLSDIVKDVLGYILLKKGVWIRNIVS